MTYIIGAYAASPTLERWDPELETAFYQGLERMPEVRGLEHPFYGTLHRDDDQWFLRHVPAGWELVFTCIPGTMDRLQTNPAFGLASSDEEGRLAAVAFHRAARDAVAHLNQSLGRRAVIAVQIHSAPRRTGAPSSAIAFARSLDELAPWDWEGATLVIEHCDAFLEGQQPEKGFLTLDEELDAIAASSHGDTIGMMVNWGRSAIEGRSPETALRHVELLRSRGVLRGLIFSGASERDGAFGAWKDTHMPPSSTSSEDQLPSDGLMTVAEMRRCVRAAGPLSYLGAKVMWRPHGTSVDDSLSLVRATVRALDAATDS